MAKKQRTMRRQVAKKRQRAGPRNPTRARGVTPTMATTARSQARFLRSFAQTGNVSQSCRAARIGRRTVYDWLTDAEGPFKRLYEEALQDAVDALEAEARRRAVEGTVKPVYQGGEEVGAIREYSDTLLVLLLKGRRPDVFSDRMQHTGKDGQPIAHEHHVMTWMGEGNGPADH